MREPRGAGQLLSRLPAMRSTATAAHIEHIEKHGRIAWQRDTGYNERSGVETQIGRYKSVIGSKLQSRNLETQQTETTIGVKSLNRMTGIGRAVYQRVS